MERPRGHPGAGWLARIRRSWRVPYYDAQMAELLAAVGEAIAGDLTADQREVLVAITLNDVPIDVLAERLQTTRGALYKTLHDARRRLRSCLAARGLDPDLHDRGTAP